MSIGVDSIFHMKLQLLICKLKVFWISQTKMTQNLIAIKSKYMWDSVWFHNQYIGNSLHSPILGSIL